MHEQRTRQINFSDLDSLDSKRSQTPFNSELRNFLNKAKRSQELVLRCEGYHSHRVIYPLEQDALKNLVGFSMYGSTNYSLLEKKQQEHVGEISKIIISENKKYDRWRARSAEIHYGVVYVYGFIHSTKTTFRYPIFKLYKTSSDDHVIFIDFQGKIYHSWDCFLGENSLPPCLMCVPKDGVYSEHYSTKRVELEYLASPACSKDMKINCKSVSPISLALDAVGVVGTTAFLIYAGPVSLLLGFYLGYAGTSTIIKTARIINGDEISLFGDSSVYLSGNMLLQACSTASTCFSRPLPAIVAICGLIFEGFNVSYNAGFLYARICEAVKNYKRSGSISSTDISDVIGYTLIFGNGIVNASHCFKLIRSQLWYESVPLLRQVRSTVQSKIQPVCTLENAHSALDFLLQIMIKTELDSSLMGKLTKTGTQLLTIIISYLKGDISENLLFCKLSYFLQDFMTHLAQELGYKNWQDAVPHFFEFLKTKFLFEQKKTSGNILTLITKTPQDAILNSSADSENIKNVENSQEVEVVDKTLSEIVSDLCAESDALDLTGYQKCESFVVDYAFKRICNELTSQLENENCTVEKHKKTFLQLYRVTLLNIRNEMASNRNCEIRQKYPEYLKGLDHLTYIKLVQDENGSLYIFKRDGDTNLRCLCSQILGVDEFQINPRGICNYTVQVAKKQLDILYSTEYSEIGLAFLKDT